MLSRAEVAEVLNTIGFRQVGNSSWFGMGQEEGRAFPVFVHLKPAYIQAEVHLNLISPCHMSALYERCNQINSGIVLGKFGLGPKDKEGRRPLILWVDLPTGTPDQYVAREAVEALLGIAFGLIRQHFRSLEEIIRTGCDTSRPAQSDRIGGGLLGQLRSLRRRGQEGG